jgi:hypothetical protein
LKVLLEAKEEAPEPEIPEEEVVAQLIKDASEIDSILSAAGNNFFCVQPFILLLSS